jgi:hypothetical protein
VKRCVAAGYTQEQAEIAYTIYGTARVSEDKITANMLEWLRAQYGPPNGNNSSSSGSGHIIAPLTLTPANRSGSGRTEFKGQKSSR